ncbi:sensor domain-containing diguanylate cyclase [Fibrobacter succinogenes]|uniref:sensor domain-containing diguanylate cyclase n=1 Tax=Fibrobacter succinogenes TaxID=833 RepID=UPI001567EDEA|nr:sensor domain-containing diguanylate cyclase [Fibrobacter succinogenes]
MKNLQNFIEQFKTMACILSVEKRNDGKAGNICIEIANKQYIEFLEKLNGNGKSSFETKFEPGSNYERFMPKALDFERCCHECAIEQKPVQAFIQPEQSNIHISMILLPLGIEDPNKAYCTLSQETSEESESSEESMLSAEMSKNVLKTCVKLRGATNLQKTMDEVIEDIRKICGANYCCVLLTNFNEHTYSVFSDSIKANSNHRSVRDYITEDFVDYAKTWLHLLAGNSCLIIKNKEDLETIEQNFPNWHRSLTNANIESLVLLPLEYNNVILGFIWVSNFDVSNTLNIKETLELTTFFVASEIANYQLVGRLEYLSNMDLLTNVQNRNSMNNRVSQFMNGKVQYKSLAVIFADLNGLKPVNDKYGHDAGDELLKKASSALKLTFSKSEIYRAGGDEFLVIILDQPKEDIEAKVQKLRENSENTDNVSFSLGFYYNENGGNIRTAMHEADVRMYEDKKQFYLRHPEKRKKL